jgi:geranylgeranylglycerol-phosphate geranylgeranyltransferase
MSFLIEFLKLTRFEHAILLALAVLVGETVTLGALPTISTIIILSLLVPIFSEMGAFSMNDYFDIETDKINDKKTPLVTGTISPKFAIYFSILAFIISTGLAFFINFSVFLIALIFNFLAIVYNVKLKDLPLWGNLYTGTTMAVPFIFGNLVVHPQWLLPVPLALAILAFIAGVAREIVKSVQDIKGDVKARRSRTLPVVMGERASITIASILYLLFIPLSFAPFYFGLNPNIYSLFLITVADGILLGIVAALLANPSQNIYRTARKATLVIFFIGMIAILWASVST